MKLSIPLDPTLAAEDADAEVDTILGITHPLDEVMSRALEVPNGIEVEFSTRKEAEAMRFRMYRRIKALRKRGINSFDKLVIGLERDTLKMSRLPTFTIKEL